MSPKYGVRLHFISGKNKSTSSLQQRVLGVVAVIVFLFPLALSLLSCHPLPPLSLLFHSTSHVHSPMAPPPSLHSPIAACRHQALLTPSAFPPPIPARFSTRHRRRPRLPLSSAPAATDGDASPSPSAVSAANQWGSPTSSVLTFQQAIQRLQVHFNSFLINERSFLLLINYTCQLSCRSIGPPWDALSCSVATPR